METGEYALEILKNTPKPSCDEKEEAEKVGSRSHNRKLHHYWATAY